MADEIIDISRYFNREPASDLPRGAMALWGGDGEQSRFALPLWRILHLARAERGMIVSCEPGMHHLAEPFVVLDLGSDPARTEVDPDAMPGYGDDEAPSLLDREAEGLAIFLGARDGRIWALLVDGGLLRTGPLSATLREDVLFLAGECAGLLFFRERPQDRDSVE
ncbi:MAG: hypothetical protein L7S64_12205 [Longimicrobiales bacterium]|jgi:hypothetical protein|nr:hypothetical protein [Longimicrobiales bacterium]